MISEAVVSVTDRGVVVWMRGVSVVVLLLTVTVAVDVVVDVVVVGAAVVGAAVGLVGAWLGVAGLMVELLLGGKTRRYLGGGPKRLRRPELGQLCRPHRDLVRGLVEGSQGFLGASVHVTVRDRTLPPHVTGHCEDKDTIKQ